MSTARPLVKISPWQYRYLLTMGIRRPGRWVRPEYPRRLAHMLTTDAVRPAVVRSRYGAGWNVTVPRLNQIPEHHTFKRFERAIAYADEAARRGH